eukprot:1661903-Rhodomonas_salina.1
MPLFSTSSSPPVFEVGVTSTSIVRSQLSSPASIRTSTAVVSSFVNTTPAAEALFFGMEIRLSELQACMSNSELTVELTSLLFAYYNNQTNGAVADVEITTMVVVLNGVVCQRRVHSNRALLALYSDAVARLSVVVSFSGSVVAGAANMLQGMPGVVTVTLDQQTSTAEARIASSTTVATAGTIESQTSPTGVSYLIASSSGMGVVTTPSVESTSESPTSFGSTIAEQSTTAAESTTAVAPNVSTIGVTLGLSIPSVESFHETSQAVLIRILAQVVEVANGDVSIRSVSETGGAVLKVAIGVEVPANNVSAGLHKANRLTAAVLDGRLTSALAAAGLEVSVLLLKPAVVFEGSAPLDTPAITGSVADRAVVA